ncbi:MAG: lysine--tRNA ligase [Pyrinomonadaceae bacterium]
MSIPSFEDIIEPNDQTEARKSSLEAIAALVGNVYPNKFVRSSVSGGEDTITELKAVEKVADVEARMAEIKASLAEGERPPAEKKDALNEELKALGTVRIAGRLTTPTRGNFVHLTDGKSKLQVYCNKKGPLALIKNDGGDTLDAENGWALWQLLDHGDLTGVEGYLFITNTGEVSVHVEKLQFLAKAMLPMPDKMHGIADPELQRRFRYADLIASSLQVKGEPPALAGGQDPTSLPPAHAGGSPLTTREVFERRAKLVSGLRRFLDDAGFIEVETPMLTPKATGAAAKPFETHHNALDIPLYARIAPELYLKRLVVGGFEKVYELNRNFRNEGLSQRHNPEFTMLEFYVAYMDVNGMMDLAETMIKDAVAKANEGSLVVKYGENEIDFGKFERISMKAAIEKYAPGILVDDRNIIAAFDEHVEAKLIQPTFIIDYPKSISPLSKASPDDPSTAERFELFINGMEVANGFSELNDPKEQYERFIDQMSEREAGDEEAMVLDEDYIRALSYGMPPAAGIGIGIDRLVMLLTNKHSIRDVILFPHMRPEKRVEEKGSEGDEES